MRGLRYARNCVHHDWSLAVTLPKQHRQRPARQTHMLRECVPDLRARKPDPEGHASYLRHLAGTCVGVSLTMLLVVFAQALNVLREHGLSTGDLPFDVGPPEQRAA